MYISLGCVELSLKGMPVRVYLIVAMTQFILENRVDKCFLQECKLKDLAKFCVCFFWKVKLSLAFLHSGGMLLSLMFSVVSPFVLVSSPNSSVVAEISPYNKLLTSVSVLGIFGSFGILSCVLHCKIECMETM